MPISVLDDGRRLELVADIRRKWDVITAPGLLNASPDTEPDLLGPRACDDPRRLVIIDTRVHELHGKRFAALYARYGLVPDWELIEAGEQCKTPEVRDALKRRILRAKLDRRLQEVHIIGPGSVLDVARAAAAGVKRKHPTLAWATNLLSGADTLLAAKYGVNLEGKNDDGGYLPSLWNRCDTELFVTCDPEQIADGGAEIAKALLVARPDLWPNLVVHAKELYRTKWQTRAGLKLLRGAQVAMGQQLADNIEEAELTRNMDFAHEYPESELASQRTYDPFTHGGMVVRVLALDAVISHKRRPSSFTQAHLLEVLDTLRNLGHTRLHHHLFEERDRIAEWLAATTQTRSRKQRIWLLSRPGVGYPVNDVTPEEVVRAAAHLRQLERLG